jgi:hypothetical protein
MIIEAGILCLSQPLGCKALPHAEEGAYLANDSIYQPSVALAANEIIENELFACSGVLFTSSFIRSRGSNGAARR